VSFYRAIIVPKPAAGIRKPREQNSCIFRFCTNLKTLSGALCDATVAKNFTVPLPEVSRPFRRSSGYKPYSANCFLTLANHLHQHFDNINLKAGLAPRLQEVLAT
jgi:hypothetical protein